MRCPKCRHEPTLAELTKNKDQCSNCGIFYKKYIDQMEAKLNDDPASGTPKPVKWWRHQPYGQIIGDAKPVVVVDIQMKFWSMVVFMVKWAIASIPAILILVLIATGVPVLFTTVLKVLM